MVRLKSLECVVCHQTADYLDFCTECGRITCQDCWESLLCPVTSQYCKRVQFCIPPRLDYLLNNAPEDELKLLNFDIWCPFYCNKCKRTITEKQIFGCHDYYGNSCCVNCAPPDQLLKVKDNHPVVRISDELRGYFGVSNEETELKSGIYLESWKCGNCKVDHPKQSLYPHGERILCGFCRLKDGYTQRPAAWLVVQMLVKNAVDLKLLTYSKWNPLKCNECSVALSENADQFPRFHQCCGRLMCYKCSLKVYCCSLPRPFHAMACVAVIKELRSLFKNGGLDLEQGANKEGTLENDGQCCSTIGQETSQQELGENTIQDAISSTKGERNLQQQDGCTSSKVTEAEKTSAARLKECASNESYNLRSSTKEIERTEGIPTTIRCIDCKVCEDISRTLNCQTCEKYGICGFCVAKKHRGHTILDTQKEIPRGYFQSKSDETLSKLTAWKEDVDNRVLRLKPSCVKRTDNCSKHQFNVGTLIFCNQSGRGM